MKNKEEGIAIGREDVIPPSKFHKEIEDKILKEIKSTDCFVKFDLLGLWVLRGVILEYYEKGKKDLYSHYFKGFKNPVIVEKEEIRILKARKR